MSAAWRQRLSRLGFGVSGAHGTAFMARAETAALIAEAAHLGITVFDTAPAYGNGEAERRLGAALQELDRDRLVISTKAGLHSGGLTRRMRDFSPEGVEASVRASLDRLQLEGVELLFLHGPDPSELTPSLGDRLAGLKSAGAFQALGVAGRGGELDAALQTGWFDAMMAPVHPFLAADEVRRLERAAGAGLAVFAIETAGDARAPFRWPARRADLYALARRLRAAPRGRGRVSAAQGLKAALARPEIACAMTTTTRTHHLMQSAQTAGYGAPVTGC